MVNDIRSQIESVNKEWMAAFKAGDATAMANLYTSQGQLLPPNSDFIRGTAAIRSFWQGGIDMGIKEAILETVEVEAYGDTAIEVGLYRIFVGGGTAADHGKYIVVWKNEGGRWKIHRDIWTTSQPPAGS